MTSALKLIAFDEDDLAILSVHTQDAILRVKDMAWEPGHHRFVGLLNRFDWRHAQDVKAPKELSKAAKKHYERRRCALRFDRVDSVQLKNIDIAKGETTLELLAIRFRPPDSSRELPSGRIELIFAGNCSIRLQVECIEAELTDLGSGWKVRSQPKHEG